MKQQEAPCYEYDTPDTSQIIRADFEEGAKCAKWC